MSAIRSVPKRGFTVFETYVHTCPVLQVAGIAIAVRACAQCSGEANPKQLLEIAKTVIIVSAILSNLKLGPNSYLNVTFINGY